MQSATKFHIGIIWPMLDKDTLQHSIRVEGLAQMLTEYLCLSEDKKNSICLAARYHDIGKAKIPLQVLNKPGKLSSSEWEIVKRHAVYGYEMLKGVDEQIRQMILCHHENEDGSGYMGLSDEQIPFGAKILHICDVYDALRSKRVYKDPWSKKRIYEHLYSENKFNKNLLNCFFDALEQNTAMQNLYA